MSKDTRAEIRRTKIEDVVPKMMKLLLAEDLSYIEIMAVLFMVTKTFREEQEKK